MDRSLYYILYFLAFTIGQGFSMWGQYFTLKFPKMTMVQAFKAAIPFAWVDWIFVTIAVTLAKSKELFTETQDIFILIITQFTLVLLINKFYLRQKITTSDFVAFAIILVAFYVSYQNFVSTTFGIPIPEKILKATGRAPKHSKKKEIK
jgi:hypothetical protein